MGGTQDREEKTKGPLEEATGKPRDFIAWFPTVPLLHHGEVSEVMKLNVGDVSLTREERSGTNLETYRTETKGNTF